MPRQKSQFAISGSLSFSGGWNTRKDPTLLSPEEFREFRNVLLYDATLRKRPGASLDFTYTTPLFLDTQGKSYIKISGVEPQYYGTWSSSIPPGSGVPGIRSVHWEIQFRPKGSGLANASLSTGTTPNMIPLLCWSTLWLLCLVQSIYGLTIRLYYRDAAGTSVVYMDSPLVLNDIYDPLATSDDNRFFTIGLDYFNGAGDRTYENISFWCNGYPASENNRANVGKVSPLHWDEPFDVAETAENVARDFFIGYYDGSLGAYTYGPTGSGAADCYIGEVRLWAKMNDFARYDAPLLKYPWAFIKDVTQDKTDLMLRVTPSQDNSLDFDSYLFFSGPTIQAQTITAGQNGGKYRFISFSNYGAVSRLKNDSGEYLTIAGENLIVKDEASGDIFLAGQDNPTTRLAQVKVFNNRLYWVNGQRPRRWDNKLYDISGLNPPVLTYDSVITGQIPPGTYTWYATFVDADGFESPPSNSYTTTWTIGNQAFYFKIDRPSQRRVKKVRLYRTQNGGSISYLVAEYDVWQLNPNAGKENLRYYWIQDNYLDSQLNTAVSLPLYNANPPAAKYIEEHLGRIFLAGNSTNPSRLYWSEAAAPEYFPGDNFIDVGEASEGAITGLFSVRGRLYVLKESSVYVLRGTTPSEFTVHRIHDAAGCINGLAASQVITSGGNFILFPGRDNIYALEGYSETVTSVGDPIQDFYTGELDFASKDNWWSLYNEKYQCYIMFARRKNKIKNDVALVYFVPFRAWALWDFIADFGGVYEDELRQKWYSCTVAQPYCRVWLEDQQDFIGTSYEGWAFGSGTNYILTERPMPDLRGHPIVLVGLDKDYVHYDIISNVVSNKIELTFGSLDTTIKHLWYGVGCIPLVAKTGWLNWQTPQYEKYWKEVHIIFDPAVNGGELLVRAFRDFSSTPAERFRIVPIGRSQDGYLRWSVSKRAKQLSLKLVHAKPAPLRLSSIVWGYYYRKSQQYDV